MPHRVRGLCNSGVDDRQYLHSVVDADRPRVAASRPGARGDSGPSANVATITKERGMRTRTFVWSLVVLLASVSRAVADPPERVARVSFVAGSASFRSASGLDWVAVPPNYPLTIGDHLWTDRAGRVELTMGATAVNVDAL